MKKAWLLLFGMLTVALSGCGSKIEETSVEDIQVKGFISGASVHDPSIMVEDGTYYIFGSHMEAAKSNDLKEWDSFASGVNSSNPLFTNLFEPDFEAFSYVGKNTDGGYSVWAPDVIYNKAMDKYVMYFSTTSSFIKSSICFATADEIEGPYSYEDTIICSGFTSDTVAQSNLAQIVPQEAEGKKYLKRPSEFDNLMWPNCIDPTVFYDKEGRMWMVYGSWSGGIFLLEIDEETGYPIHPETDEENGVDCYYGKKLIGGLHNSIEGPYILYHEETDYYYLFVSYGELTSEGGYQIRTFRSKNVDGPYEDAAGEKMMAVPNHAKYGVKLMGNYKLPSNPVAYMAPGHCSAFTDEDGTSYVVYHTRFDDGQEYHEPRVHRLYVTNNGWLTASPFAVNSEAKEEVKEGGYEINDMQGTWYVLNHELDIDSAIHESVETTFGKDGTLSGGMSGTYEVVRGKNTITIEIEDEKFEGVIFDGVDEAGNSVRCFSAVSNQNQTVWGVHYK